MAAGRLAESPDAASQTAEAATGMTPATIPAASPRDRCGLGVGSTRVRRTTAAAKTGGNLSRTSRASLARPRCRWVRTVPIGQIEDRGNLVVAALFPGCRFTPAEISLTIVIGAACTSGLVGGARPTGSPAGSPSPSCLPAAQLLALWLSMQPLVASR